MNSDERLVIREYDGTWPDQFARLAARVSTALGSLVSRIEHIGSTAVPGLAAKPIIDLDVVLASQADLPEAIMRLAILGYVHEGNLGITGREAFLCPAGEVRHHLYVLAAEAAELRRHVVFRDALRSDPALREAYAALKRSLAGKQAHDRVTYNAGKSAFVMAALDAAANPIGNTENTTRRRELREELGLELNLAGPVHSCTSEFEHAGEMLSNTDIFFVGESNVPIPKLQSATEAERAAMQSLRWWSVTEIEETEDVIFPSDLGEVIRTKVKVKGSNIRVREFQPEDVDALVGIFRSAVRVVARRDYTQEQVVAWAPDQIDSSGWEAPHCASRQTFVAEVDGTVAGFTDLEPDGHLNMMYVHAEFQGRGVASALLSQLEAAAHRQGLESIYTEASITARTFFERRGFELVAQQLVSTRGQDFINFRMRKSLI